MSLRERLDTLSRAELAGLAVVVLVTLAGVGLWYTRSLPKPIQVAETPAAAASAPSPGPPVSGVPFAVGASASASVSAAPAPAELIVDVAGWVRHPGVYRFDPGARIVDAVERAGGARDGADLMVLNLAAPLTDGQQVLVPKKGQTVAPVGTSAGGTVAGATGGLVNINTADEPTLETLNGVGPVTAAAIIKYREENGPFATVDQLDAVSGIGPATLEELRDQVTV
ncbi:MAG: helix-hairpin-helix domain-containing protein [Planctomycetaceae bacterium]